MAADALDPDARPERARAVRAMRNVAACVVMLVAVAAAAWLALSGDPTRNRPLEISADATPERLPPDPNKPNGAEIPHQGQIVYEIVGRDEATQPKEGLAPKPEQPIAAPPAPVDDARAGADSLPSNGAGPVQLLPPAPPPIVIGGPDEQPELPSPPPIAAASDSPPSPPSTSDAPPTPAAPPAAADSTATQDTPQKPPVAPQPSADAPKAVAALPPSQPDTQAASEPPPLQPPSQNATPPGPFRVQLGAVRNTADAQREWRRLRRKHADVLGGLQLFVQQVNIPNKGVFHRIQAGPLEQRVLAEVVCDQLIARKAACFVIAK